MYFLDNKVEFELFYTKLYIKKNMTLINLWIIARTWEGSIISVRMVDCYIYRKNQNY